MMTNRPKDNRTPLRAGLAVTVLALATGLGSCAAQQPTVTPVPVAGQLSLDGVTIVSTETGALTPNMSVLMNGGRIVSISPTSGPSSDRAIQHVDATGKFVVPGYNNMHDHALGPKNPAGDLALMLTEGVTGFRQMSGSAELLKARREGQLPIGKDAPALLTMPSDVITPFNARSPDAVRALVRQQKADGADFIKMAIATPDIFYAAIDEAKKVGLPIVGHLQEGVDPAQAGDAGFHAIEHLGPGDTVWIGCSTSEPALLAEAAARPLIKSPPFQLPAFVQRFIMKRIAKRLVNPAAFADPVDVARLQRAFDTYSADKCEALAARFVADGVWQTPTLVRLRTQYLADDPAYQTDPALASMPEDNIKTWRAATDTFRALPADTLATYHSAYGRQLVLTKLFFDSGVPMMAGTDGGGAAVPGQTMQQEFEELAKAGIPPLGILQMTTLNPARFLGRTATMGTVGPGQNADLVILDANPVADARNLRRISGVVRAGFYYSAGDLAALKGRVEAARGDLR
jgi:imidazolonepropionase-like amidohydrolase